MIKEIAASSAIQIKAKKTSGFVTAGGAPRINIGTNARRSNVDRRRSSHKTRTSRRFERNPMKRLIYFPALFFVVFGGAIALAQDRLKIRDDQVENVKLISTLQGRW